MIKNANLHTIKKTLLSLVLILIGLILVACKKEEPVELDKVPPLITVRPEASQIHLKQNEVVDIKELLLSKGLSALDNKDGNISENIQIGYNDFDISKPGEYILDVFVYDSSNNKSEVKFIKVIVEEYYGLLSKFPVYSGKIEGEVTDITKQSLFKGAFYFKTISTRDKWFGIEGTVVLPEAEIKRYNGSYNTNLMIDPLAKNLDNPSVYMGGVGMYQSDVGLSLSTVVLKNGLISTGSYAFRPFWRYITSPGEPNKDIGGWDLANGRRYGVSALNANQTNMYANWTYLDTEYYYLPGDKLRMIVYSPKPNHLQLQIEVIEKSTLPSSVQIRQENGWKDPENFLSPIFVSDGHGLNSSVEFKRVNAIDQVANEGKEATPTTSNVKVAVWESVYLYRLIDGISYRVPFNAQRSDTLGAPDDKYYTYSDINPETGGVSVIIHPNYEK